MTKPMTPERYQQIKARCEAATEGPWERYNDVVCNIQGKGTSCIASTHRWGAGRYKEHLKCHGDLPEQEHQDNCNFITHARQDLPACLDEIERLEQELSLEKANAEMRRKEIRLGVKEIVRLEAREDEWAKLLKSANNDVERLDEYINHLQGTDAR